MDKDTALRLALEALEDWNTPFEGSPDEELITAIKAALEAQSKPDHSDELTIAYMSGLHRGKEVAQRTWVGLTDEEVMQLAFNFDVPSLVIRTTEAKLKEKNT